MSNKKLAIRGNYSRGSEVINVLETLGGNNINHHDGKTDRYFYYIDDSNKIQFIFEENMLVTNFTTYTLDSFYDKYPYTIDDNVVLKTGVVIKIINMYLENDDILYEGNADDGTLFSPVRITSILLKHNLDDIVFKKDTNQVHEECCEVIGSLETFGYKVDNARHVSSITDDIMINQITDKVSVIKLKSDVCDDKIELQLGNYEIEVINGKTYAVKKKPKIPNDL